jgi:hypothetical protein
MRGRTICSITLLVSLSLAAPSDALRLGAKLERPADYDWACTYDPFCTWAQTKIDGKLIRAPVSGTITRWSVKEPNGTFWLQVLRKRENGKYRSLRSTHPVGPIFSGTGEVSHFKTHLKILKGDFIGIGAEDFYSSSLAADNGESPDDCFVGFVPGLVDGESAKPVFWANPTCTWVLLYNARLIH